FGNLHFYNSTFDQNIAEIKFLQNSILDTIKFAENAIIWENDFVNFGVHSEFYKVDSERRQLYEMMINKEVTTNKHLLNATFEQFWGDSLFSIFSLNHKSKFSNFKFSNFGYFNNENDYQATSKFTIHINEKISTNVGYFTDYAFCGINLWNNQFSIGYKNKNYFYEFKNKFKMKFFILQLKINNYLILDEKNIKFASLTETFQTQNKIEITYLMKHNNNITLDLNHIRLSGDSHLNAALKFQITKFFELSTTAINLTNSSQLFGEKITGRHFNFNVRWIFLN
ncbi:MAG: hypothetical protein HN952_08545, partial [Candidatus Cloacimonetes bacterium]|nr:hypothetical protein [Candidatus Cloacimonadota bacterium]